MFILSVFNCLTSFKRKKGKNQWQFYCQHDAVNTLTFNLAGSSALQMDNYKEDRETDEEKRCSGWGEEGIENNKTRLITVGYRGLIRFLCHIMIKHVTTQCNNVTLSG